MTPLGQKPLPPGFLPLLLLLSFALLPGCRALGVSREAARLMPFRRGPARDRMEDLGLGCPPKEDLLPCVCALRGSHIHVTCENSELDKIVAAMEILMKMVHKVEELTLIGNRIHLLPGRIFGSLQINKLFLINNELMGITRNAFAGLESSLQHIYIKDRGLYDIPFDTLDNLANLRTCVLEETDIIEIPRLYSLSKLEFLKIDGSRVSSIPSAAFRFMPNMKKVHISNSLLKEVKGNALEGLVYLKEVNFSNNIIDWIHPRAFRTLNAVEHLSLAGNNLSDAGMAVLAAREMRELRILDMSRNRIAGLTKGTFVDMPNIRTINLSENIISKVDHGAFFRLPSIRKLDISGNAMEEFHADIFTESSNLEHLSVANNNLTFVAEMRYIARSLPNLRSLDISENRLKVESPRAFEGHPKLEALKVDHNKIEKLRQGTFKSLPNLRELYLSHNLIDSDYSGQLWNLPKLRVLDMSHNELRKIDVSLLEGLPRLSSVDLSFNLITDISAEAFLGSPQMKNLNVSYNSIGFLPENVFQVLTELFELELSFNELTVLYGGLFQGLTKLEYLHLTHNQITTVEPGTFRDTENLQYLDLSANFIQELPSEALSKLASLRVLKLHRNAINKVQDSYLSGLKSVEHLDLSNNHIQTFNPAAFIDMTHLRDVDLSVNYMQNLHPDMFTSTKLLEKLNISHNYISSIGHESFVNLKKLRILDLTNNSLTELGDAMIDFPELQALFLSENYISSLENSSFVGLPSLSVLHFKNNGLQTFETTAFHGLRSLVYLDLRNNNLVELNPDSFIGLTSLQEMQISKNQISIVKDFAFSDLPALRSLELQDNVITELGGRAFYNLPTMKFLNLSRNGLQDIPEDALGRLPSLDVLDLSSNFILEIKDSSFYRLEWLTVLMMHDNDLCRMSPGAFARQRALRVLTLNNNQLKRLHLHALGNTIKGLSLLDMSGNPFQCDCEMVWLREYLGEPPEPGRAQRTSILGDSLKGVPVCASPEEYKGMPITEVPVTAFLCGGRRLPDAAEDICVPRFLDPLLFTGGSSGSLDPGTINTLLHLTNLTEAIPQADTGPSYLDYNNPIHVPSAPGLVALSSVIEGTTSSSSAAPSTSTAPTTAAVSTAEGGVATVAPTVSQAVRSNQSEQLLSSSNIHTVTGDTPTIYAGSAGHTDDNKQQDSGLFSGIKLPTLPNLIESISNLNLPQLGLNVNWGNIPILGRQDTGLLGKSGPLGMGKPMKGPDVSNPIWVEGPSSPHPLFPNPPSPPPPKDLPPPLSPDKNPSRGPHPVSAPGGSFVFPTGQGDRLRPGVPGVVVPVTRPSNIWAARPQPGRPRPGNIQGPGSGQQKRPPHQVNFLPGSPILPSITHAGPGPNSGTPFLPGLSIKQNGRPLPTRPPSVQNQGPGSIPLTPPPVPPGSSPSGQGAGTTWPGNLWSQPEVINPDSGVSLYQPREPFQPYQPHDPNHPITVVDAPNMSSNQGGSSAGMPTSPLMPMGPPVHTSPSPPDMSPSESQMVAEGANRVPDTQDKMSGGPQTGSAPKENISVDSRLPDALPPFSGSSGRGKDSQEMADSQNGFQIPFNQQGQQHISVSHDGQQIPFSHSQHPPENHQGQQVIVSHQEQPLSNNHGQQTSNTEQQIPFNHQEQQKPTRHQGQQKPGEHPGQQRPSDYPGQQIPPSHQGQHTVNHDGQQLPPHDQQNHENRDEQERRPEGRPNIPIAPTQPADTRPGPVRPTDNLPNSQGPVPPQESLDDLINLLYAAEAEVQHEMQDTAVTTPSSVSIPDETLLVDPSDSASSDSAASASVPEVGVSFRPEVDTPLETSSTTLRSTTSTSSRSTSTMAYTTTPRTTIRTTARTTTTTGAPKTRQDLPPDMLPPQLGKGVTVVQGRPPDFQEGPPLEPDSSPPARQPEDHSQSGRFPPDGDGDPGHLQPDSEDPNNFPPLITNPAFGDAIPTGSQTATRYRPGVVLPVDKAGEPLPGARARVPPNNTQISPSRSIGRGGVPTIERVEQPSHRQHSDKTAVVQGVDLPEENVSGDALPPIPNTEFETSEVNTIDWYYSNYFREYDPYANLPVGGNEPPSSASTASVMFSTIILCIITVFYNHDHLL